MSKLYDLLELIIKRVNVTVRTYPQYLSENEKRNARNNIGIVGTGKDGVDGKDGYTPQKNVDYFDGKDGKDGYTPVKGVDYFDGQPGKDGVDGRPGEKGDPGVWVGSEAPPSSDYTVWVDPAGEGSGSSASVQSDWNASEGEPGYIKNKPFGTEYIELFAETEVIGIAYGGAYIIELPLTLDNSPETLKVVYDGVEYICHNNIEIANEIGEPIYGNIDLLGNEAGEPFAIYPMMMCVMDGNPHTLSIFEVKTNTIPEEYIPVKKFYCNDSDDCIYMDYGCTKPALIDDIPDDCQIVICFCGQDGIYSFYNPVNVRSRQLSLDMGYCTIGLIDYDWANDKISHRTLYSGEHFAPT